MHKKFKEINEKYEKLMGKAKSQKNDEGVLFFQYGGELSISSDLSNELRYKFPEKIIVVIYVSGDRVNISVRGDGAREIVLEVIKDLEGATGGDMRRQLVQELRLKIWENLKKGLKKSLGSWSEKSK